MLKLIKFITICTVIILLLGGIILANINLEQYNKLISKEQNLQRDIGTFLTESSNESLQIIKMQAERVLFLESQIKSATVLLQSKDEAINLREGLLVSTAEKLQKTIDELAVTNKLLDSAKSSIKYLTRRIHRLENEIIYLKKEKTDKKVQG